MWLMQMMREHRRNATERRFNCSVQGYLAKVCTWSSRGNEHRKRRKPTGDTRDGLGGADVTSTI